MKPVEITEANFENEVVNSDRPVMVDFWASWCGPCKMLSPIVEEIASERSDIKVGKVNVDEQEELAEKFSIMSIPCVIVFRDGKEAGRSVGYVPKEQLLSLL